METENGSHVIQNGIPAESVERVILYNMLPYLRVYMGHKTLAQTAYYIHLLPENLLKSKGIEWDRLNDVIPEAEEWED